MNFVQGSELYGQAATCACIAGQHVLFGMQKHCIHALSVNNLKRTHQRLEFEFNL